MCVREAYTIIENPFRALVSWKLYSASEVDSLNGPVMESDVNVSQVSSPLSFLFILRHAQMLIVNIPLIQTVHCS